MNDDLLQNSSEFRCVITDPKKVQRFSRTARARKCMKMPNALESVAIANRGGLRL